MEKSTNLYNFKEVGVFFALFWSKDITEAKVKWETQQFFCPYLIQTNMQMPRKFPLFVYSCISYKIFSVSTTPLSTLNFQSIYIIETSS